MKKKPKQKSFVQYVHENGHETCNSFTLQTSTSKLIITSNHNT